MVDLWTGTILDIDEPSDTELGYHGGNEIDRINKLLKGYDLTTSESADVTIRTLWNFLTQKMFIRAADGKTARFLLPDGLSGNIDVTLPNQSGTLSVSSSGGANDWGNNMQTFRSNYIRFANPAATFYYNLITSAITANRNITIPLLTADDTISFISAVQTLTNKTLASPIVTGLLKTTNLALKEEDTNTLSIRNAGDTLYKSFIADIHKVKNYVELDKLSNDPTGNPPSDKVWLYVDSAEQLVYENDLGTKTVIGGGTTGGSGSYYDLLTTLGYRLGAYTGEVNTAGHGILNGNITNVNSSATESYSYATSTIPAGRYWEISGSGAGGWNTTNLFLTPRQLPDLEFYFGYYNNSADWGHQLYAGLWDNMTSLPTSDDEIASTDGIIFVHDSDSGSSTYIARNDGGSTPPAYVSTGVSLGTYGWTHIRIRLFCDQVSPSYIWKWQINGGNVNQLSSDLPSLDIPLGILFKIDGSDSDTRGIKCYYGKIKTKITL